MPSIAKVLIAEDSDDDVLLLERAFKGIEFLHVIHRCSDGEEVIAYLTGREDYGNRQRYPLPDLLLLDLKMPKVDGFGVLEFIKTHPEFHKIRVAVLSASTLNADIGRAFSLGAHHYQIKPSEFIDLKMIIQHLERSFVLFRA